MYKVVIEKFPSKKKFTVDLFEFAVDSGDEQMLTLTWTPSEAGGCREIILLRVDQAFRLQFVVVGQAVAVDKPKKVMLVYVLQNNTITRFQVSHQ